MSQRARMCVRLCVFVQVFQLCVSLSCSRSWLCVYPCVFVHVLRVLVQKEWVGWLVEGVVVPRCDVSCVCVVDACVFVDRSSLTCLSVRHVHQLLGSTVEATNGLVELALASWRQGHLTLHVRPAPRKRLVTPCAASAAACSRTHR